MADPIVEPKVEPKVEPEAEPEPKVEAAPKPEPKVEPKPEPDWKDRRMGELTHKLNEAKRELELARKVTPAPASSESPEVFETRVQAEATTLATQIAANNEWNRQCDDVAKTGRTEFPDFNDRIAACNSVVNFQDPGEAQQFNDLLSAAIETGQAHRLLHELGANPGEVRRLMAASPAKRIVELTRMADKMVAPVADPEPSGAPKPITPIGSKGVHLDGIKPDDPVNGTKLPKAEWFRQREKQVEDKRAAGVAMQ